MNVARVMEELFLNYPRPAQFTSNFDHNKADDYQTIIKNT